MRAAKRVVRLGACCAVAVGATFGAAADLASAKTNAHAAAADTTVKTEVLAGASLSWPLYIAQERGYFKANHLNVELTALTGGVTATNALVGGSLNVAGMTPLNVAPLLTKGVQFKMLVDTVGDFFGLSVQKQFAGDTLPQILKSVKTVGVPEVGGEAQQIFQYVAKAYGDNPGAYQFATDITGTGFTGGHEDAIMTTSTVQCVLKAQGYPSKLSFLDPVAPKSSYPASLQKLFGAGEYGYWASDSWIKQNPRAVSEFQQAIEQTLTWASNPANGKALDGMLRKSSYNLPTLNTSQFDSCVKGTVSAYTPDFSGADATLWSNVAKSLGVAPKGLPPASQWLASGLPQ